MADPHTGRLRVVIAEDHYLVREGTRQLLETGDDVTVLAAVGDAEELLAAVATLRPEAVPTDIRMPPTHHMEGIEAAHRIRADYPQTGVVVLSQHADEAYVFALLQHGTAGLGYLLKERVLDRTDLVDALFRTAVGRSVLDPVVVDTLVGRRARLEQLPLNSLTSRELRVLSLMAQGTNQRRNRFRTAPVRIRDRKAHQRNLHQTWTHRETHLHRRVSAVVTFLQRGAR